MKNYYRILQVDPEAEQEVIDAAYKRLMKKYHPDTLSAEQKMDKAILEKVQEINEAYGVLSDDEKRKKYDKTMHKPVVKSKRLEGPVVGSTIEKRNYAVRCSVSKNTHRMVLARKKGTQGKFTIAGFELVEMYTPPEKENWVSSLGKLFTKPSIKRKTSKKLMSDAELENLFANKNDVSLADVDWSGDNNCPDCGSEITLPTGIINHWFRCGVCSHLYCTGNAKVGHFDAITKCPWCGKTNVVQWSVSKDRSQLHIGGGEYKKSVDNKQRLLPTEEQKSLSDGNQ